MKENQRRKELEEKQRRAKLAKEKADREKEERKRRRQPAGVDLNAGKNMALYFFCTPSFLVCSVFHMVCL